VLKEKTRKHEFPQLSSDFVCLLGEVSTLRSAAVGIPTHFGEISVLKTETAQRMVNPVV
jgi:hypothetical protein